MSVEKHPGHNQRCEPRFQPCLEEVLWRSEGTTGRAVRGCLRDVSNRGLSFLTARRPAPQVGAAIRVHLIGAQECAPCEVRWVEKGQQLAAVGCRMIEPEPEPSPLKPPVPS
ncbi:MAG: PilZ domain-containing protein, partial [Phycisphaerae bacterium]